MYMFQQTTWKVAALALAGILAISVPDAVAADSPVAASSNATNDPESVTVTGKQVPHSLLNPGVALDGVAGISLERDLDRLDIPYALLALGQGLSGPLNQWYEWRSIRGGVEGRFFPTREFREGNRLCRDFTIQYTANRNRDAGLGTACQAADGIWHMR